MKQKGNILPAKMGPVPSTNRVNAGISIGGLTARIPTASARIVLSFTNVLRAPRGASSNQIGVTEATKP